MNMNALSVKYFATTDTASAEVSVDPACFEKTGVAILHHVDDGTITGAMPQLKHLAETILGTWLELKSAPPRLLGTKCKVLKQTTLRLKGASVTLPNPKHAEDIISLLALERDAPNRQRPQE